MVIPSAQHRIRLAGAHLSDGRVQMWRRTRSDQPFSTCWQTHVNDPESYNAWRPATEEGFSDEVFQHHLPAAAVRMPDGRAQVWAIEAQQGLLKSATKASTDPDADWQHLGRSPFTDAYVHTAAAAITPGDPRIVQLWAVTSNDSLITTQYRPFVGWSQWKAWSNLGSIFRVFATQTGRGIRVWAGGLPGGQWVTAHSAFTANNTNQWSTFEPWLPSGLHMAAAPLPDGRLQVWGGTDNKIFTRWQIPPNFSWTPWAEEASLPTRYRQILSLYAKRQPDGRLHLWALAGPADWSEHPPSLPVVTFSRWKVDAHPDADWTPWEVH